MKIYNDNPKNPIISAVLDAIPFDEHQELTTNPAEADVIITDRTGRFNEFYAEYGDDKFHIQLDTIRSKVDRSEENVFAIGLNEVEFNPSYGFDQAIHKCRTWASLH